MCWRTAVAPFGTALAVNHLDRSRADVYDLREQGGILAASLASGSEARGVELVRDEHITEVLAGGLEALVCLKIAHELLFAVSADAPLGGHESAGVPDKQGEVNFLDLFRRGRLVEAGQVMQDHSRPNVNVCTEGQSVHYCGDNVFKAFANEVLPFVLLRQVGVDSAGERTQFFGGRLADHPPSECLSNDRGKFWILPWLREGTPGVRRSLALVGCAAAGDGPRCQVLYRLAKEPVDLFSQCGRLDAKLL
jgi:hypothetical protein